MTPASATTAALASATQLAAGSGGAITPAAAPGARPWERAGTTVNGVASTSYGTGTAYGSGSLYNRPGYGSGYGGYSGSTYGNGYGSGYGGYGGSTYGSSYGGGGYGGYGSTYGGYGGGYGGYGGGYGG